MGLPLIKLQKLPMVSTLSFPLLQIREKIPASSISFYHFIPDFRNFKFDKIQPEMIKESILSLESKTSLDIDGINTKVLRAVA